jgi:molybdate transport system permease protein
MPELSPLALSLLVTSTAILLILPFGTAAAWWLAFSRPFPGKLLIETLLMLPLVLPPTVVGFGLLLAFGRGTALGAWLVNSAHIRLIFTWQGAALAAAVMAAPLYLRTAASAFASVDHELLEAARTYGAGRWDLLRYVIIPLSFRGLLAGVALAFARALGEFGATYMVAGNIPGRTQTLPVALFSAAQGGNDRQALLYALWLSSVAFIMLAAVGKYQRRLSTH